MSEGPAGPPATPSLRFPPWFDNLKEIGAVVNNTDRLTWTHMTVDDAVARPRDTGEVAAAVRVAADHAERKAP
jgi:hypothetical protein